MDQMILMTKADLVEKLRVSIRTVDQWIANKALPVVRPTRKLVRFRPSDVDEFIEGLLKEDNDGAND